MRSDAAGSLTAFTQLMLFIGRQEKHNDIYSCAER